MKSFIDASIYVMFISKNSEWGNALKRSPGIIRKSRVSYPGPGFLSSATWPSLPKKHYNGLNQTKPKNSDTFEIAEHSLYNSPILCSCGFYFRSTDLADKPHSGSICKETLIKNLL